MTSDALTYVLDGWSYPVVASFHGHGYSAYVLHAVEEGNQWVVTWTDGINRWVERYDEPWHALGRLASLVAACEQDVFLVHDVVNRGEREAFLDEVERYVSRTVHASSCAPSCDGRDPVNHRV